MSEMERMRMLKTSDGKGLFPMEILDILESFMNDPMIYNPEINIANLGSSKPPRDGFIFSPDIFAKTFT